MWVYVHLLVYLPENIFCGLDFFLNSLEIIMALVEIIC